MSSDIRQDSIDQLSERNRESAETLRGIALVLADANQQICNIQIEAIQAALSENSRLRMALLEHATGTPTALEQWSSLFQGKMERWVATNAAMLRITSHTIIALNQLLDRSLQASLPSYQSADETETEALAERRISARMIIFPERRNRSTVSEIVLEALPYGDTQGQTARKKSAA